MSGLVYAAKAPVDPEVLEPEDWPFNWDFPGPPWPPGWPKVFDGLLPVTATAAIDPSTGECAVTATVQDPDGLDAADLDGFLVRVRVYDEDDNQIDIKKTTDAAYSAYLLFWVSNYTGPSYGFSDTIVLDTTGLQGKTLAVLCDVPGVQTHNIDGDLVDLEDSAAMYCPANPTVAAIGAFVCEYDDPADYAVVATVDKGATVYGVPAVAAASPANAWDYGTDAAVTAFTEGETGVYTSTRRYTNTASAAADAAQYRVRVRYRVAGQYDFYLYSNAYDLMATIDANTPTADTPAPVSMPDATEALYTDIVLTASDPSDHAAGTIVFSIVSAPAHGTTAWTESTVRTGVGTYRRTLRYTPNASGYPDPFLGVNTMTFKVGDGNTESGAATVTVTTEYMDEAFAWASSAGGYLKYEADDPALPAAAISCTVGSTQLVGYDEEQTPAPDLFQAWRAYGKFALGTKFAAFNISAAEVQILGAVGTIYAGNTMNLYKTNADLDTLGLEDDGNLDNLVATVVAAEGTTAVPLDHTVFASSGNVWLIVADAIHVLGVDPPPYSHTGGNSSVIVFNLTPLTLRFTL